MLADGSDRPASGALDSTLHLPGESIRAIIAFIGSTLPAWRDDPNRKAETSETKLTAQLCSRLNSASHRSNWDFLQFKREEPDEDAGGRSIDLAATPKGRSIMVEGRRYSEYQTLLPIECKRLPTPPGRKRDPREYLYSQHSSTGGIDRFKNGHHAAGHKQAAMIGYVQGKDIPHWKSQFDVWVAALGAAGTGQWSSSDTLSLLAHNAKERVGILQSSHTRVAPLEPIAIDHLWIEM